MWFYWIKCIIDEFLIHNSWNYIHIISYNSHSTTAAKTAVTFYIHIQIPQRTIEILITPWYFSVLHPHQHSSRTDRTHSRQRLWFHQKCRSMFQKHFLLCGEYAAALAMAHQAAKSRSIWTEVRHNIETAWRIWADLIWLYKQTKGRQFDYVASLLMLEEHKPNKKLRKSAGQNASVLKHDGGI